MAAIKTGRIALILFLHPGGLDGIDFGINLRFQSPQIIADLPVAGGNLLLIEIEQFDRLFQCKHMLGLVMALQGLCDGRFIVFGPPISHFR